jgi:hypothetical protein
MKKIILIGLLLTGAANAGYWQCYSVNNFGQSFFGTAFYKDQAARNAIYTCQGSTPYGGTCWATSTCDWFY